VSASGVVSGAHRDYLIRARICPCDPTRGDSCRHCDGTDDGSAQAAIKAAVAAVTARQHHAAHERRPA
jgi:hypothetical protein